MTSVIFAPVAQAVGFAIGCYALHTAKSHADRITPYLTFAAVLLGSLVLAVLTIEQTDSTDPFPAAFGAEYRM